MISTRKIEIIKISALTLMSNSSSKPRFRFAPSPTGYLHIGNARVALLNYLYARSLGGEFLLRMDDTDSARGSPVFDQAIFEDLSWFGLEHDLFARQSERMDCYEKAIQFLKDKARLYPCFETPEELGLKRKVQLARGLPPVYDRAALALGLDEIAEKQQQGLVPHWRFRLSDQPVSWEDQGQGAVSFQPGHLSDPVLIRADGRVLYSLSSVVDDGELGITHVLRGADHVANTAVQIDIAEALGYAIPSYIHLPLLLDREGAKLSKREGGTTLRDLRADGTEATALRAYLAGLGSAHSWQGNETADILIEAFSITHYGKAAPRFDASQLLSFNRAAVHALSYEEVSDRLSALLADRFSSAICRQVDAIFWEVVRTNLDQLSDVIGWVDICFSDITLPEAVEDEKAVLPAAIDLLPADFEDREKTFENWIKAIKEKTGARGKELFRPLRMALTGQMTGPELRDLCFILGRERIHDRLCAAR